MTTLNSLPGVAHQPRQEPRELPLVLEDQQFVGPLVTLLRAHHELLIDLAITHPIPDSSLLSLPNGRCGGFLPFGVPGSRRKHSRGLFHGARFHGQTVAAAVSSLGSIGPDDRAGAFVQNNFGADLSGHRAAVVANERLTPLREL